MALGIPHGGSCPRGRRAEDGPIPNQYVLYELASTKYSVRTEKNVVDADGTLIIYAGSFSAGTALTHRMTVKNDKPEVLYDITNPPDFETIIDWLFDQQICVLNVAGPRESTTPGIQSLAFGLCKELFAAVRESQSDS